MVTLRDVAERAGVSPPVVSAVISGSKRVRMSTATRERVEAAIKETGYRTHHAAKALKMSRSGIVAAIIPKITNPVFDPAITGIQDAADEAHAAVMLVDAGRVTPGSNLMTRLAGTGMADGFLVRSSLVGDATIDELVDRGIPCVVLNGPPDASHICVWVDDNEGIHLATSHVLDLGHRRVALVGGPAGRDVSDARRVGFERSFTERGLAVPANSFHPVGYELPTIKQVVSDLLSARDRPTALVVDNVVASTAALAAAADLGLRVPSELSIVAYHDIPQAEYQQPAMTTVRMPVYEAGYRGYQALARMIDGKRATSSIVSSPRPQLIVRGSTQNPP